MNQSIRPALAGLITASVVAPAAAATTVVDFDDVNLPTAYAGPGGGNYYNGSDGAGGFTSNSVDFPNSFTDFGGGFTAWDGFAVSSTIDTTTAGFGNQYSAFTGEAFSGSQYAVAYASPAPTISFGGLVDMTDGGGMRVTNTTYAALAIRDGDDGGFGGVTQFGGVDGNAEDWFLLTIEGFNGASSTGVIDFYLADYRFADNSLDYFVDDWEWVDFASLGEVDSIQFSLSSSDNSEFEGQLYMNTPAYFAVDNFTVPEPSAALLAMLGGCFVLRRRR